MDLRSPATLSERDRLAAFPFLPGGERLTGELAHSLRDLLADPALARARELGRLRIRQALDDPSGAGALAEVDRAEPEVSFLSFQYARLLLAASASPASVRRWAVAESKRSTAQLDRASVATLVEIAGRLGFDLEESDGGVSVALPDYLRLAVPVREAEFRLSRQRLAHGRVAVDRERAARLLQEGIRARLAVPLALEPALRDSLAETEREFLADLRARIPSPAARAATPVPIAPGQFPPCVRKMRRALEAGENLSHSGRFALAAFLHRIGVAPDAIVDAYRGAPDFDEGTTRYQVEHITTRDEGRGYDPPSCETLRAHGLCMWDGDAAGPTPEDRAPDRLCHEPFLRHPLQYYEIRSGWRDPLRPAGRREGPGGASGTTGAPAAPRSTAPRR